MFEPALSTAKVLILSLPLEALGLEGKAEVAFQNPAQLKLLQEQRAVELAEQQAADERQRMLTARKEAAEVEAQRKAARIRTWTATGGQTLEAEFVNASPAGVKLKKKDGSVITVKLEALSKDDQKWIRGKR